MRSDTHSLCLNTSRQHVCVCVCVCVGGSAKFSGLGDVSGLGGVSEQVIIATHKCNTTPRPAHLPPTSRPTCLTGCLSSAGSGRSRRQARAPVCSTCRTRICGWRGTKIPSTAGEEAVLRGGNGAAMMDVCIRSLRYFATICCHCIAHLPRMMPPTY